MGRFVKVGTRAEFEGLEVGKLVQAGGQGIAILNIGGSYYAIENTCPHRGGPLSEGTIAGDEVTCPWHGSRFNIKTGAVITPPARQGVKSFPVRIAEMMWKSKSNRRLEAWREAIALGLGDSA